jgi:hypothetical protein
MNTRMRARLDFDLPEEQTEFDLAVNASKLHSVLWELDQFLRAKVKYAQEEDSDIEVATYDKVRTWLHNELSGHNIDLYEL